MLKAIMDALDPLMKQPGERAQAATAPTPGGGVTSTVPAAATQLPSWLLDSFHHLLLALLHRLTASSIPHASDGTSGSHGTDTSPYQHAANGMKTSHGLGTSPVDVQSSNLHEAGPGSDAVSEDLLAAASEASKGPTKTRSLGKAPIGASPLLASGMPLLQLTGGFQCGQTGLPAQAQQQQEESAGIIDMEDLRQHAQRALAMAVQLLCRHQVHAVEGMLHAAFCGTTHACPQFAR